MKISFEVEYVVYLNLMETATYTVCEVFVLNLRGQISGNLFLEAFSGAWPTEHTKLMFAQSLFSNWEKEKSKWFYL